MIDRLSVLRSKIQLAYNSPEAVHTLAGFVFDAEKGNTDFLTPQERERIAVHRLGHTTQADRLVTWVRDDEVNDSYVLTSTRNNLFGLTITDNFPGGRVQHFRIGWRNCSDETRDTFMASPFVSGIIEAVINTRYIN